MCMFVFALYEGPRHKDLPGCIGPMVEDASAAWVHVRCGWLSLCHTVVLH